MGEQVCTWNKAARAPLDSLMILRESRRPYQLLNSVTEVAYTLINCRNYGHHDLSVGIRRSGSDYSLHLANGRRSYRTSTRKNRTSK